MWSCVPITVLCAPSNMSKKRLNTATSMPSRTGGHFCINGIIPPVSSKYIMADLTPTSFPLASAHRHVLAKRGGGLGLPGGPKMHTGCVAYDNYVTWPLWIEESLHSLRKVSPADFVGRPDGSMCLAIEAC